MVPCLEVPQQLGRACMLDLTDAESARVLVAAFDALHRFVAWAATNGLFAEVTSPQGVPQPAECSRTALGHSVRAYAGQADASCRAAAGCGAVSAGGCADVQGSQAAVGSTGNLYSNLHCQSAAGLVNGCV